MWSQEPVGVRVYKQNSLIEQDRRRPRLALVSRLFFFDEEGFEGEATLLDVSTGGCRVSTVEAIERGKIFNLSLFLPDHHTWPLRTEDAIVRWVLGRQFGLEFTTLRTAQRDRLRAILMQARRGRFNRHQEACHGFSS